MPQGRLDVLRRRLKRLGWRVFKGKRKGLVVDDRVLDPSGLISLNISIERFDGRAHEGLGFLQPVLPLGQFQEQAAPGEEGIGESLLEGPEAVAAILGFSGESDSMGFPFATDRFDVIDL